MFFIPLPHPQSFPLSIFHLSSPQPVKPVNRSPVSLSLLSSLSQRPAIHFLSLILLSLAYFCSPFSSSLFLLCVYPSISHSIFKHFLHSSVHYHLSSLSSFISSSIIHTPFSFFFHYYVFIYFPSLLFIIRSFILVFHLFFNSSRSLLSLLPCCCLSSFLLSRPLLLLVSCILLPITSLHRSVHALFLPSACVLSPSFIPSFFLYSFVFITPFLSLFPLSIDSVHLSIHTLFLPPCVSFLRSLFLHF